MRATLTDDGCTYEGDTTPAPGLHTIEVENKTTHFATFAMWKLAPGVSAEDVQHAYTQALADFKRTHKIPRVGRLQANAPLPPVSALSMCPPTPHPSMAWAPTPTRRQRVNCLSMNTAADS